MGITMPTTFFLLGALSGALAVALGAFGAHGLKSRLSVARLENYETAARYQMYHALALLAAFFASRQWPSSALPAMAGWLFIAGMLLFSGSLYLLALTGERRWGVVTPFGGLAFIAGWICLALSAL
jgi:uncharacterized membrane protein YgdD (TMEM256/DUF423 family)